jgi:hypothetical protein
MKTQRQFENQDWPLWFKSASHLSLYKALPNFIHIGQVVSKIAYANDQMRNPLQLLFIYIHNLYQ